MTTSFRATQPVATGVAPIGFIAAYLAAARSATRLPTGRCRCPPRPRPRPPPTSRRNPLAVITSAVLQVVSVACFAVFVAATAPLLRDTGRGAALSLVGYLSVAAMVLSSLAAGAAAVLAPSAPASTVDVVRQASFYAAGSATS